MRYSVVFIGLICALICSCSNDTETLEESFIEIQSPEGFPEFNSPAGEEISPIRVALGRRLFFDTRLSINNSISCGSCHFQGNAFSDPRTVSEGVNGLPGERNAQPLFNLAWRTRLFRDGGVDDLALSALNPINNPHEMRFNIVGVLKRLNEDPSYQTLFRRAFDDTATAQNTIRALAIFQRLLISGHSRYDQKFIQNKPIPFTEAEQRGYELFFGPKARCSSCHGGFNFSNEEFRCNGLFESYPDSGRQRITFLVSDRGKFLVPSLRNIAVTAPYMHNGSITSLEEVLERYNEGGTAFFNKDQQIQPLGLNEGEKADLKAFLLTLTDSSFLNNPAFQAY
jgi:cytochrome c peroxidase